MSVKTGKYIGLCMYDMSYRLLWSPVIGSSTSLAGNAVSVWTLLLTVIFIFDCIPRQSGIFSYFESFVEKRSPTHHHTALFFTINHPCFFAVRDEFLVCLYRVIVCVLRRCSRRQNAWSSWRRATSQGRSSSVPTRSRQEGKTWQRLVTVPGS